MSEVLPPSDASDGSPSLTELPVHCTCNEVITKDWVTLEPHIYPWSGREAIHEQEPDHLSQIEGFIVIVDGATKKQHPLLQLVHWFCQRCTS
jgi:hypothetical protein